MEEPPPDVVELVHQRLMNIYANTENGSLFSNPEKLYNEAAKKWDFTHPTIDLNSGGLHSTEFYGPAGHLVN